MRIPNIIEPLINQVAYDIVTAHRDRLLHEEITYIVTAIWGAKKDGRLDKIQEDIFRKAEPVIQQVIKSFDFQNLHTAQVFGVAYLVKGLIVSKITYMLIY
ncbi:MAG: hypothetical protein U5J82_06520 [Desulfobacterales bacterium]|nr:hypothetical protein [Desulfobacterales bacterium]